MTLIMDPFKPEFVGLPYPKDVADVLTISHDHEDHSAKELVTGPVKRENTFVIYREGEYEIGGVEINAMKSFHDKEEGAQRGKNLMMIIRIDGLTVCHLGDLGHKLSESQVEKLGSVDVLMIPVGGVFTIDAQEATDLIKEIQPSVVIPMHFKVNGMKEDFATLGTLEQFLDKCKLPLMGEAVHKTKIDESSLPDDTQVLVMNG